LLLLFTLELLINLAIAGGVGGMEHPAEPADTDKASVWRLPIMRYLLSWPEFDFIEVAQGLWGAPSRKPTGLLLLNLPAMIKELRAWQITGDPPRAASIGLKEDGTWATSSLKEYPPAFCGGLASGFVQSLHGHPVDQNLVPSKHFRRAVQGLLVTELSTCAGPDYAG